MTIQTDDGLITGRNIASLRNQATDRAFFNKEITNSFRSPLNEINESEDILDF